jgi:hypothetical protein
MMMMVPFEERAKPLPRQFVATVLARDPSVLARDAQPGHRMLRTQLAMPATRLEPGPRGSRFQVVDFDASTKRLAAATDLTWADPDLHPGWAFNDRYLQADDQTLLADPGFRAQNVYAIASRTLAIFEAALGRPVPWSFPNPQLYLVPTAFQEANAYYADDDQALYFGYFPADAKRVVYTCLAHDIVAHETTHAILDGLRSRFDVPSLPDQAGFHEGFADIVGLLSILASPESIAQILGGSGSRVDASEVTFDALRHSVLVTVGREFGNALHINRGVGLRRSVGLKPTTAWRNPARREWEEPHRRGEILVAAVLHTFLQMWTERLEALTQAGTLDRGRTAEEGALAASHLLQMAIRAIDYCPPVEFEFEDFLAAMLTADAELEPDDAHAYRPALREHFKGFGIVPAIAEPSVFGAGGNRPSYRNYSYAALRSDPDEAFRFMWDNAVAIDLTTRYYTHVDNVRPSTRVAPSGAVVSEWLVDYVQELIVNRSELEAIARPTAPTFATPADIPSDTQLKLYGGGTLVFNEFGALKYHQVKRLDDWHRQQRRLEYLVRQGLWDTRGRLGFGLGMPLGQRFAVVHAANANVDEEW